MAEPPEPEPALPHDRRAPPKRVMGGRPALPRVVGRTPPPPPPPPDPATTWVEVEDGEEGAGGPPVVQGMTVDPSKVNSGIAFHHNCCQAVRPNPEDAGAGAVEEVRTEPYLTWQGRLKPSASFGVMASIVGLCVAAAFILVPGLFFGGWWLGVWIFLVVAGVLTIYTLVSMAVASSALGNVRLAATRHVEEPKLERGHIFHATLDTSGTVIPGGLRVQITDQVAPGLRPVEQPLLEGPGRVTYKVRPQGRGLLTFAGLDVAARSFDGLWLCNQEWRLRTTVEVNPSLVATTWKALVTGYVPFDQGAPSALVKLYRDIEDERYRDLAPGDKMRDVNWKYFARMGKMIVRERKSEGETTILLVFDCTQTMLMDQAGFRNLDMAIEIAQEMAEAGLRRNHECGMIAFNETRVLDHVRPTRAKIQYKKLVTHFQNLANHHLPEEGEDPVEIMITGDPENLRLAFGQGLKQRNTAGLTMIFFTDLQGTPDEMIQLISKAASSGQKVAVMLLPEPKLKPILPGRESEQSELVMRGLAHTNKMRELLIANACEFQEVNPHPEDFTLTTPSEEEAEAGGAA